MRIYAIKLTDGVAIMQCPNDETDPVGEIAKWRNELLARVVMPLEIDEIDRDDIPADRTFRDGWVKNGAAVEHDMAKCREIAQAVATRSGRAIQAQALADARTPADLKALME